MIALAVLLALLVLVFLFMGLVLLIWGVGMRFLMFAYGFCIAADREPNA